MFFFQFGLLFVVAAASAAPQQFISGGQPEVRILDQKFDQDPSGNYEYVYQQDNGQQVRIMKSIVTHRPAFTISFSHRPDHRPEEIVAFECEMMNFDNRP